MEELLEILEEMKPGVDFKSEKHLIDDKVFDSLAIMALVAKLSDEFDVEIPDEQAEHIRTVGELVSYIEENM